MQLRSIVLVVSTVVVFLALGLLFVEARHAPSAEVPDDALEQAKRRHERAQQRVQARLPPPEPPVKPKARTAKPRSPEPSRKPDVESPTRRPSALPGASTLSASNADNEPVDLDTGMDNANRMYDRRDYTGAIEQAKRMLERDPKNIRMLRVIVSSSCIMGDEQIANEHYARLPKKDQRHMQRRCKRYGMTFGETE